MMFDDTEPVEQRLDALKFENRAVPEMDFANCTEAFGLACHLLSEGRDIQKISVVRNLPQLFNADAKRCNEELIPLFQEVLNNGFASLDLHCEGALAYRNIISNCSSTDGATTICSNGEQPSGSTSVDLPSPTGDDSTVRRLLAAVFANLESPRETLSSAVWLETLVDIVEHVTPEIIRSQILPVAIKESQHNQIQRRVISTKLLEKLSTRLSEQEVKGEVVPSVQLLCQDVSATIRASMCQRLTSVAQALGAPDCCSLILPSIIELCCDEDDQVRQAVLSHMEEMMSFFDIKTKREIILPLLKKCANQSIKLGDPNLPIVAKALGQWCYQLRDVLSPEDGQWFLDTYRRMALMGMDDSSNGINGPPSIMTQSDPDGLLLSMTSSRIEDPLLSTTRKWCAYNFPAMLSLFGNEVFERELLPIFRNFCVDSEEGVVKCTAASFHQIVAMVTESDLEVLNNSSRGKHWSEKTKKNSKNNSGEAQHSSTAALLIEPFIELVKIGNSDVVAHLASNLAGFLPQLYAAIGTATDDQDDEATDSNGNRAWRSQQQLQLDRILLAFNRIIRHSSNWRSHESFLGQMACLVDCMPHDRLLATFVPLLKEETLTTHAIPCRRAAVKTLLTIVKSSLDGSAVDSGIIDFLVQTLCLHQSCHKRMLFLDCCQMVAEMNFPQGFLQEHFLPHALKLKEDKVSNVRLKLCQLLPGFKRRLILPTDERLLSGMEAVLRTLLTKENKASDRERVQSIAAELSRTEAGFSDTSTRSLLSLSQYSKSGSRAVSPTANTNNHGGSSTVIGLKSASDLVGTATTVVRMGVASKHTASADEANDDRPTSPPSRPTAHSPKIATVARSPERATATRLRVQRPRTAVVRPQPQTTTTVVKRSPSPMPQANAALNDPEKEDAMVDEEKPKGWRSAFSSAELGRVQAGSKPLSTSTLMEFRSVSRQAARLNAATVSNGEQKRSGDDQQRLSPNRMTQSAIASMKPPRPAGRRSMETSGSTGMSGARSFTLLTDSNTLPRRSNGVSSGAAEQISEKPTSENQNSDGYYSTSLSRSRSSSTRFGFGTNNNNTTSSSQLSSSGSSLIPILGSGTNTGYSSGYAYRTRPAPSSAVVTATTILRRNSRDYGNNEETKENGNSTDRNRGYSTLRQSYGLTKVASASSLDSRNNNRDRLGGRAQFRLMTSGGRK